MARIGYEKALAQLKGGQRIMVTLPSPNMAGDRTGYCFQSGDSVSATTFRKLADDISPVRDGLFPDGPSQTYEIKR